MIEILIGLLSLIVLFFAWIISAVGAGPGQLITGGALTSFQKHIRDKFRKYKISSARRKTFHEYCFPASYNVQPQQAFAGDYMKGSHASKSPKELLVFHKIGAGKTCLAIQVAKNWQTAARPLILMPASLIPGFQAELAGECGHEVDPDNLQIMSYNKFLTDHKRLKASILIIDEVQNVDNPAGEFCRAIYKFIDRNPDMSVVVMTGTPIFDKPDELISIGRMLRIDFDDNNITPDLIRKKFARKVSFFAGAPDYVFPTVTLKIAICRMSKHQSRWYKSEVENERNRLGNLKAVEIANDFYIKSRQRANISYPSGLSHGKLSRQQLIDDLATYSAKGAFMVKKLRKNRLTFIYVEFTNQAGIELITSILHAHGYVDFLKHGPGRGRYALWTGNQTLDDKAKIRAVFNSRTNDNASQIQVILGSPAIKEGVSLYRVVDAHIWSAYWNHSRLAQIYGRVSRFCSHKTLPKAERRLTIYQYAAVTITCQIRDDPNPEDYADITPDDSVDLYMLAMADRKKAENDPYVEALVDCAIDRGLFQ